MIQLKKIDDIHWQIPIGSIPNMKVPGMVFASEKLLESIKKDRSLEQIAGVATLPGIYKYAIGLPDTHEGYGFNIGGVAALDFKEGGISPGGIGYDINCGVRLLRTNLMFDDIKNIIPKLVNEMFVNVPSGLGSKGLVKVKTQNEFDNLLKLGAKWAVDSGYGWKKDLEHLESNGQMLEADPRFVSDDAKKRGMPQSGSLGAGNHFLEIQKVDKIYDIETAKAFGIEREGQITVMIHTGSRGLGHQVCSDYLRKMERAFPEIISKLPDRELIYAPAQSQLADEYFKAMSCAANFAWCNRQMIVHWIREAFQKVLNQSPESLGMNIVYDVAHNIAKIEEHDIDGHKTKVYVHRKGATRAFPKGHPEIPMAYRSVGQPVILPGSMGTASYLLVGTQEGMKETFGSTAHGAGRIMSRHAALRQFTGDQVTKDLAKKGIWLKTASKDGAAEEAPGVYKDIDEVARVSHEAGIGRLVVRLVPLGVVKG